MNKRKHKPAMPFINKLLKNPEIRALLVKERTKTLNLSRRISAEAIAKLADKEKDISQFFTNKGKMHRGK